MIRLFRIFIIAVLVFSHVVVAESTDDKILLELKNNNYPYLDKQLQHSFNLFEKNVLNEGQLHSLVYSFYRGDKLLAPHLDGWVEQKPNSAFAYLARGVYKVKMGWMARGDRYIKNTSNEEVSSMRSYFESALRDLSTAKKINPNIINIYSYEIEIAMGLGLRDEILKIYSEARKINPYSFMVHSYYLSSLVPRWGGSYDQMTKAIEDIGLLEKKNPALKVLGGRVAVERAYDFILKGDYLKSIEFSNQALSYGDYWQYYSVRGDAYSRSGNVEMAIKDFESALMFKANLPNVRRSLALGYLKKNLLNEAIDQLTYSFNSEPLDAHGRNLRGYCYLKSSKFKNALSDFSLAVELEPSNLDYLNNKGIAVNAVNGMATNSN